MDIGNYYLHLAGKDETLFLTSIRRGSGTKCRVLSCDNPGSFLSFKPGGRRLAMGFFFGGLVRGASEG